MGASKSDFFSESQNQLASLMKALGHPARIAIIEHLLQTENCVCGDIVDVLPLAQPTISQHLKELKSAGLIQGTIEGNAVCYCLNEVKWKELETYLIQFNRELNEKKSACC